MHDTVIPATRAHGDEGIHEIFDTLDRKGGSGNEMLIEKYKPTVEGWNQEPQVFRAGYIFQVLE